jgi:hypothetical protein
MPLTHPEVYFSFDVEADGPYPGDYSMLSVGLVAVGTNDGNGFKRLPLEDTELQIYREFCPISKNFDPGAVEVCAQGGLIRDDLKWKGTLPDQSIPEIEQGIRNICARFDGRAIAVAYPLGFDWMFLYWYLCKFGSGIKNPFGFSGCLDIKSLYAAKANALVINSTKRSMPKSLKSKRAHTHNALDDALEQGDLFCSIMEWAGKPLTPTV